MSESEMTPKEQEAYNEALKRIRASKREKGSVLDLSEMGLTILPPEIGQLVNLTKLFLYGNQLCSLPPEIGQLVNLTQLTLSFNQLSSLPKEIVQLVKLTQLDLYSNQLSSLPQEIGQLVNLTKLELSSNKLSNFPKEIGQLVNLTSLNLSYNDLSSLPKEIGQLVNLISLDLSRNQLSSLPQEIGQLVNLTSLYLSYNQLSSLPKEIGQLINLISLDLSYNQLSSLPEEVGQLVNLTSLNLSLNQLSSLPKEIGQLVNLTSLYLSYNQLSSLPKEIGQLVNLTSLNLSYNDLSSLPKEIGQLVNLISLDLSRNQLSSLPQEIGQLVNLTSLYLSYNQLSSLPKEIGQLINLISLDLSYNQLSSLPKEIGQLINLTSLYLGDNKLISLPEEIGRLILLERLILENNSLIEIPTSLKELRKLVEFTLHSNDSLGLPTEMLGPNWSEITRENPAANPRDILDYYFALQTGKNQPLNEVKVLVVGESEVGKTSLIRQLRGEDHNQEQDKTHGIERHQVKIKCDRFGEVRLNVWDFGGQDIMHATHQFFLTHRSVYLLVLDSRQNERQSRIDYWLRLIASYGGDSPVIIVCNKADQQVMQLNWNGLQRDYPQIKAYAREVSCFHSTNEDRRKGLVELRQQIASILEEHVKEVNKLIPKNWLHFKNQLEKDPRPYLSLEEYHSEGAQKGIQNQRDRELLLTLMHQLGSVLHFSEHAIFETDRKKNPAPGHVEELNVLDPGWVTCAIYKLLNDAELIRTGGIMDRGSMRRSLAELPNGYRRYPVHKEDFILAMMRRFEICFAFDGDKDQWFLPDLLHKDEVDTGDWKTALSFRYQYRVLPGSVISRLMVRLHGHIARHCLWRTGAKFNQGSCEALVRTEPEDAWLDILIRGGSGRERREFLALIRGTLANIHSSFSDNLGVKELVLINTNPVAFVGYQKLLLLEESGVGFDTAEVEGKLLRFSVVDALNGITELTIRNAERDSLSQKNSGGSLKYKDSTLVVQGDYVAGDKIQGGKPMTHDQSIHIGGDVIGQVGQTLQNCTNMVQQQMPGEKKNLLEALETQVKQLLEKLPPEKQEEVAGNLDLAVKAATGVKPNRAWYTVSSTGLLEASKFVKDFSGNMAGTLTNLGKLLWTDFALPE